MNPQDLQALLLQLQASGGMDNTGQARVQDLTSMYPPVPDQAASLGNTPMTSTGMVPGMPSGQPTSGDLEQMRMNQQNMPGMQGQIPINQLMAQGMLGAVPSMMSTPVPGGGMAGY